MIKSTVRLSLYKDRIQKAAHRGAVGSLARASGYLRTTIKRTIRYRKRKESKPGQPPFDHGTFRKSIRFNMDRKNLISHIGPARLVDRQQNPDGKLAPETLEFGGVATRKQTRWFTKNPPEMKTMSQVTTFFMHQGYGPIHAGDSPSQVMDRAQDNMWWDADHSKQTSFKKIRSRKRADGKTFFYLSLPLRTTRMAARAARTVVKFFGFPTPEKIKVAPRPYLAPGLDKAKSRLSGFFVNSLK